MKTFGAFDIAALQKIYGANMTAATGNDVYTLPMGNFGYEISGSDTGTGWTCIWDTGGDRHDQRRDYIPEREDRS